MQVRRRKPHVYTPAGSVQTATDNHRRTVAGHLLYADSIKEQRVPPVPHYRRVAMATRSQKSLDIRRRRRRKVARLQRSPMTTVVDLSHFRFSGRRALSTATAACSFFDRMGAKGVSRERDNASSFVCFFAEGLKATVGLRRFETTSSLSSLMSSTSVSSQ
jgi:hypothetical protein